MRTFWIADPTAPSRAGTPLRWGSSEWAADSCLAEWSDFEREWTGGPAPKRPGRAPGDAASARSPAPSRSSSAAAVSAPTPAPLPPLLFACFVLLALGLGAFAWSVFRTLFA